MNESLAAMLKALIRDGSPLSGGCAGGPGEEGIQKKPSVRRPSSATLDSARYRLIHTGSVTSVGRQPASGFTLASWYSLAISTCRGTLDIRGVCALQLAASLL